MILSHKLRTIHIFFGIGSKDVKTTNESDSFCCNVLPQDSLHWPKFWLPRCFFTSCPPKWCGKSSWWRQTANTYLPWLEEQFFGRFRMRSQTGSVWFAKNISVGSHIIRATDMDDFRPNDWSTSLASHLFILVVRKTLALLSCFLVDSVRMRCADATGSHWKSGTFALHAYRFTAQMLQPFVPRSVYTQSRTQRYGVSGSKTLAVFDVAWWMRGLSYTSLQKSYPVIRYPLAALILHVEVQAVARASNATEIQIQSSKTWAKSCWSCWGRHSLMDERFPGSPRIALRENLAKATPIFMVIRRSWHVETCRKHSIPMVSDRFSFKASETRAALRPKMECNRGARDEGTGREMRCQLGVKFSPAAFGSVLKAGFCVTPTSSTCWRKYMARVQQEMQPAAEHKYLT